MPGNKRMTTGNDSLARDGYLIARNFLDAEETATLQSIARRAFAAADAGMGPPIVAQSVQGWGGFTLPWLTEIGCDFDVGGLIVQRAKPLIGPCLLLSETSLFRRVKAGYVVTWHIDADVAPKTYDQCMNVWVPLASVGKSLPSLELVQGSHRIMRAELPPPNKNRDPDWVNERFAHSFHEIPQLEPGDALIFDHYTMHRTQAMNSWEGVERVSGEFRVALC
jgi:hypothetical protein